MSKSFINESEVIRLYTEEKWSTVMIADHYGTYCNKINRVLQKYGVPKRTKAEAQQLAIEESRAYQSSGHSEEVKKKIGKSRSEAWRNLSQDERDKLSETYRTAFYQRTPEQLEAMRRGLQKSSREGSHAERFFIDQIKEMGYEVLHHTKDFGGVTGLEVDILVPQLMLALEIDGVFHRKGIHGDQRLDQQKQADTRKNALLNNAGYRVIRVEVETKSDIYFSRLWDEVEPLIENEFEGVKYIKIEK